MKKLFCIFFTTFITVSAFSQNFNKGKIEQKEYFEKIPYSNTNGIISVKVSINEKEYNFLLDTGAPFAISERLYQELNSNTSDKTQVFDSNGKEAHLNIVSVPKVCLGNIAFLNTLGLVLPESAMQIYGCHQIDGIIGSNMLRKSIIQFDSENKQIILTNNPENLELKNINYQKMTLTKNQSSPFIQVILKKGDKDASINTLFDTGNNGFFDITTSSYDYFAKQTDVFNEISSNEGALSWGIFGTGDKNKTTVLNIPQFILNKTVFDDIVATTTNSDSKIGNKIFKYGKTTMDYKRKRFYFEPYKNVSRAKLSQRPWSVVPVFKDEKLVVGIIWDKQLENQVNLGDEIINIDGIDYSSIPFCDLIKSDFKTEKDDITTIILKDIHTGKIKEIEIKRI